MERESYLQAASEHVFGRRKTANGFTRVEVLSRVLFFSVVGAEHRARVEKAPHGDESSIGLAGTPGSRIRRKP